MSGYRDNKHYVDINAYHNIQVNDKQMAYTSPFVGNNVLINVVTDSDMTTDTHITSIVISDTVKDGKYVEHLIARDGSFTHYKKDTYFTNNVKVNGESIATNPAVSIMTSWYRRDTFSSKITTTVESSGGGESESSTPTQIWIG